MTLPNNIPCPNCLQPVEFDVSTTGQFGKCPSCCKAFCMPDESTCVTDPQMLLQIQSRDTLRTIRTAVIVNAVFSGILLFLVLAVGKQM